MGQSGGFLGRLLGSLLKTGFLLIGNVLKPLVKSVLIPLALTEQHQQQVQLFIRKFLHLVRRH